VEAASGGHLAGVPGFAVRVGRAGRGRRGPVTSGAVSSSGSVGSRRSSSASLPSLSSLSSLSPWTSWALQEAGDLSSVDESDAEQSEKNEGFHGIIIFYLPIFLHLYIFLPGGYELSGQHESATPSRLPRGHRDGSSVRVLCSFEKRKKGMKMENS
jgi:hypothetical protein